MGDPKQQRRKYQKPSHPWERARIDTERVILEDYGLKNKKEIWKMQSKLRNITSQIKKIIGMPAEKSEALKGSLQKKLVTLGLIQGAMPLEDAMNLSVNNIMDRRLQTLVYKKGMARSIGQARQFISHAHIVVGGRKITAPSYLVSVEEEPSIGFVANSSLFSQDHPERVVIEKKPKPKRKKVEKKRNERR